MISDDDNDSSDYQNDSECSVTSVSSRRNMSPSNESLQTQDYRYCGGSRVSNPIISELEDDTVILTTTEDDTMTLNTPEDDQIEMPRPKKQNKNCLVYKNHAHSSNRNDEICWLCTFATHPKALQISTFIVHNIANIDIHNMSSQIKDQILELFPRALGVRKRDIIRHICDHMLSPNVRMAATIRSLMALADTVKTTMHQRESETGELVIDLKGLSL
jgi:hypothetical protein